MLFSQDFSLYFISFIILHLINITNVLAVTLDKNTISLSAENTSSDTISIAWKCKSRCINESSFEIEFAVASIGHVWMEESVLIWTKIKVEDKNKHTITDLFPNTGYDIRISLLPTNKSSKLTSSILYVSTAIAIPIVQNLRIDNKLLLWSRIEDYDIQIQFYQVEVREVSSTDQPRQFIGNWGDAKNGQVVESSNNWTIDGLSSQKYYQFSVHARTSAERGDSTPPTSIYSLPVLQNERDLLALISIPIAFILIVLLGTLYWQHRKSKKLSIKIPDVIEMRNDWLRIAKQGLDNVNIESLPTIPREDFDFGKKLGKGAFGEVYKAKLKNGEYKGFSVAVKTINDDANDKEKQDFMTEAYFMNKLRHNNIITLIGVCQNPFYIVLELMDGDLRNFLIDSRPPSYSRRTRNRIMGSGRWKLNLVDLLSISIDVASGCEYLESQNYIHRDIAARNCLVSNNEGNLVVKLADFGLARNLYKNALYLKEGEGRLPVRWMAPESICDMEFTTKSDVWSYGVMLWEVMKLGETPYGGFDIEAVIDMIKSGNTPEQPIGAPDNIYSLMEKCWTYLPQNRPTFSYICQELANFKESIMKIGPISDCKMNQSALLDLLAPTNERVMLAGFENLAFTSDEYDNSGKPGRKQSMLELNTTLNYPQLDFADDETS